jgi:cytochrome c biogenesis protein ResB
MRLLLVIIVFTITVCMISRMIAYMKSQKAGQVLIKPDTVKF